MQTKHITEQTLTKVVTTISLTHRKKRVLKRLILAGSSIFRINLSHFRDPDRPIEDQKKDWTKALRNLWTVRTKLGAEIAIMLDTCGPEFRVRLPKGKEIKVQKGKKVILSVRPDHREEEGEIPVSTPDRFSKISPSEKDASVRIDDGKLTLSNLTAKGGRVSGIASRDYSIRGGQGVNLVGLRYNVGALTKEDVEDLTFFLNITQSKELSSLIPIDYIAQSFVKSFRYIRALRNQLRALDTSQDPRLIAKFETVEATKSKGAIRGIVDEADGVMIARGDLATEHERYRVPQIQRHILDLTHRERKPVILATGVYQGMTEENQPTRAEAENVRSALEWGIDAFMLSDETAIRPDADFVIRKLIQQIVYEEDDLRDRDWFKEWREEVREDYESEYQKFLKKRYQMVKPDNLLRRRDMALATAYRINNRRAAGVFMHTLTGQTARELIYFLPNAPIYALMSDSRLARQHLLYRGFRPVLRDVQAISSLKEMKDLIWEVTEELDICNEEEDFILGTAGFPVTDTLFTMGGWER